MKNTKKRTIASVAAFCSVLTMCSCASEKNSGREKTQNNVTVSDTSYNTADENIKAEKIGNITPASTVSAVEKETAASSESKNILGEFNSENSWLINPRNPEEIIGLGSFPIKVKIVSEEEALFLSDDRLLGPSTPYKIELLDDYDNLDGKTNIDVIYLSGGDVTVEAVTARLDQESIVKYGLDKVNENERKTTYFSYVSDYDCELIPGEEYIVLVDKDENGHYYISCSGYGVFKRYSSNAKSNVYKNVITDIEFKID